MPRAPRPRPIPRSLPVILRIQRTKLALSVPELAQHLGRTESLVYAWESPQGFQRAPSPRDLQLLLDMTGASNKLRAEALAALALATADRRRAA